MSPHKKTESTGQSFRGGFIPGWRVILALCFVATLLFAGQEKVLGAIAVLFGDSSVEISQDSNSVGSAEAFQVTASAAGTLGGLEVYLDSSSRATQLLVGLYANAGGSPGVLLTQGSSTALQAGAWNLVSVPSTNVSSGTVYWIALLGTGGTLYFRDSNSGGCSSFSSAQNNLTGLPSTWSSGSGWPTCRLSAYGVPDPSQPILSYSPATITFSATQGGGNPNPAPVTVNNAGGGTLSFTDASDSAWLGVSPSSGTAPQNLTVSATVSGLAAGTYTGHVTVTAASAQGSPGIVTVSLTVAPPAPPPLPTVTSLSPANAAAGGSAFTLTVTGANFISGDTVLWNGSPLTTKFASATQLSAAVSSTLIAASGSARVGVQAPGGATSNSVSFAINAATPQLSISPTALSFNGTQGSATNPSPSPLNVTNSGNGSLTFTASSDSAWLSVAPASGTAPQSLQISVLVGTLTVGTYTGHLTVTAAGAQNSPASVPVTFTVAADTPPVISNAGASSSTSNGAVITWTTDKASSSQVNYGTTTAYGTSSTLQTALVTTHSVTLSGLTAGTLYHYEAQSADAIGTVGSSRDLTFTTTSTSSSCPCSIWSSTTIPGTPSANDNNAVELGVKFTSNVSGYITSIRFYKGSQNTGAHTGTLWTSGGTQLATATFTGETSSGWQQVNFASPVAIAANATYVASYHTTAGYYAGDNQFFATSAVNQPPLQALANGTSGGNGVYVYSSGGVFPNQTYESTNYWVDVVFNPTQTLPATYSISGTIAGGNGATVTLSGAASAMTTANGSGNFSFSSLANGSYTVTPSKTGFTFSPASQSATVSGANVTGIAFTAAAQTFSISGTITGGSGATVMLSGAASASITASASGNYTFNGLANGSYTVTPSKAGYTMSPSSQSVTVSGANVTAVNFTATAPTFGLSGSLTPAAGGAGAKVTLSGVATATTTADGSGNYSFSGVANGKYAVTPSNPGYSFSPTSQAVTINGANATGVNFTATAVAPTITTQPANQTVTVGQTATFSVTATGTAPLSYQWLKNGTAIGGATSVNYTTPATTLADSGEQFSVTVSNAVGNTPSRTAALTVNAVTASTVDVVTYHYDNLRTGQNLNETILTPANVNSTKFGKLGAFTVDGRVDAQPLYLSAVAIPSVGTKNVLYVATEHGSVYAFDADSVNGNTSAFLWKASVLGSGETSSDDRGCGQVTPEIGVTATPVIARTRGPHGAIYVVAMSKDANGNYFHRLHALDLTTGAELFGGPMLVQATYPGTGDSSSNGNVVFEAKQYKERPGLLQIGGTIYTTWSSHCDARPYTSWVMSYDANTLAQTSVLNLVPNGSEGGIWMAGTAPGADPSGNIFFMVGNGDFDTTLNTSGFPANANCGQCYVKLSPNPPMKLLDYFTPSNTVSESNADTDFGSGGPLLLPDLTDSNGTTRHLAVGSGKDAIIYVVDRDNMGKFNDSTDNIYQEINGQIGGVFSKPSYFNNMVYYGAVGDHLKAFPITNAKLATMPATQSSTNYAYPGTTPSISANGTSNGIVWAVENGSTGVLHAYNATNLTSELYNSNQAANSRDHFSDNKYITPMVASGKVYVGTPNSVVVFGLLP